MIQIAHRTPAADAGAMNLYPHTELHRWPTPVSPLDTMVSIACRDFSEGPFDIGDEDLESIAASVLLPWRDPPPEVLAQAEVISEAYRHDTGLTAWRPGRRGIVAPWIAPIARLCFSDTQLTWRRAQVYRWLCGKPVSLEDWAPPVVEGMTAGPVTLVQGPLWMAWEVSPIGVTEKGVYGVHPGARHKWWLRPVRFRSGDGPREMLGRVLDKVREK